MWTPNVSDDKRRAKPVHFIARLAGTRDFQNRLPRGESSDTREELQKHGTEESVRPLLRQRKAVQLNAVRPWDANHVRGRRVSVRPDYCRVKNWEESLVAGEVNVLPHQGRKGWNAVAELTRGPECLPDGVAEESRIHWQRNNAIGAIP